MAGARVALIIANDEYDHEALRNLQAPAADAEALRRVLGDHQIGGFAVEVVRNEPHHIIERRVEDLFTEGRPDDLLLLHFSGHGLKSDSGELFFAASDTLPSRLGSTAVSAAFVHRCMRLSRSRSVVLLLDCCYGGAFAQGVSVRAAGDVNLLDSFPRERLGGGRGRAVITASTAMEYAFEGERLADEQRLHPSVFTSAVVEGLDTGDADRDEDGWVSLSDLYDYVFDKVREQNPHQTPTRQVELEGELYLARTRRRRIRPAPLPADLQAAVKDLNMYTRLGAVSELRLLLASDDLPSAAGAYQALDELAHSDIRRVAGSAAIAVSQAALDPAETDVHFGQWGLVSAPPHHTVRLLGPPIARACTAQPSADWIRVTHTGTGLDITVDTDTVGIRRGIIDLKGPTGEAAITVDIEIVPPAPHPSPGEPELGSAGPFPEASRHGSLDELSGASQLFALTTSAASGREGRTVDQGTRNSELPAAEAIDSASRSQNELARRRVTDLRAKIRHHADASQWQAVLDASAELTRLDPSSAAPDLLARDAAYQLGEFCSRESRTAEAKVWFESAANRGHDYAAHQLGMLLWKKEADQVGAERWLRKAAPYEMKAAYQLGELLWEMNRPAEAKEWFETAANQVHNYAAYQLGMLLWKTEADQAGAERWLRKAAPHEMKAAYELGELMWEMNRPAEAKEWFEKAANQGYDRAAHRLRELPETDQARGRGSAARSRAKRRSDSDTRS